MLAFIMVGSIVVDLWVCKDVNNGRRAPQNSIAKTLAQRDRSTYTLEMQSANCNDDRGVCSSFALLRCGSRV
jgi:hypothetical protein